MKHQRIFLVALLCLLATGIVAAQPFSPRADYVWARAIPNATVMTLDGKLNEAVWAQADSIVLKYGTRSGDPGSGYLFAGTNTPTDPANAVIKFLADPVAKRLYIGVIAKDSSVGGPDWEACDGFFASLAGRGTYLGYKETNMWWLGVSGAGTVPAASGWLPSPGIFDGMTRVLGVSSSDTGASSSVFVPDTGYVMEMVVRLDSIGVNPAAVGGDVLPIRICIWDGDYNWPNKGKNSYSRVWWQGEWTAAMFGRVYFNPAVTTTSGTPPAAPYDLTFKSGADYPNVAVDGDLSESVWTNAPWFDVKYGDAAVRATYPPMGQFNSNGWQALAPRSGIQNDTGVCRVKYFFKGDSVYFGFDVTDRKLVSSTNDDRMDAVRITFWDGADSLRDAQGRLKSYRLTVRLDSTATALADNDLTGLITRNAAKFGAKLKNKVGGQPSTINNPGDTDAGYTVEVKLDLTKLGYASGAQKKTIFWSMNFNDGNVYTSGPDSFCTRTWYFHEWEGQGPSALSVLDETNKVTAVNEHTITYTPGEFRIYNNFPNPFNPSTHLRFSLPEYGSYMLRVYDLLGRVLQTRMMTSASPGVQDYVFNATGLASGVYYYTVDFTSAATGERRLSDVGRMLLMK
ncbi:MAG: T9SS type A sorting domain-containing protein [Bacteroidota bacterium]